MKLQLQGARAPKTTHIQQINLHGYRFYVVFHFQLVFFSPAKAQHTENSVTNTDVVNKKHENLFCPNHSRR